jgi:hypothetical protein
MVDRQHPKRAAALVRGAVICIAVGGCSDSATPQRSDGAARDSRSGGIPANPDVDETSSYTLARTSFHIERQAIRTTNPGTFAHAVAYLDADADGDLDVFIASGDGTENRRPLELYRNDAGQMTLDASWLAAPFTGGIHPRKAILGDYNGDGRLDIFVADHGHDQPPFPGAAPFLLLTQPGGTFAASLLTDQSAFNHAAASADVDADGDIDIFLSGTRRFLLNDGTGAFTAGSVAVTGSPFTVELIDIDRDGWIDLLVGGHDYEADPARIVWGGPSGLTLASASTTLPGVAGLGVIADVDAADLDGDGDTDLVLTRTGEPPNFYQGYDLQILVQSSARTFVDETATRITSGRSTAEWFDWIRLVDLDGNGSQDILVDDRQRNLRWLNDGNGHFLPAP